MSDETRQNRSKRDKMRQDIKLLIIATILQPDNLKIQYLCPFPAIIHYSNSTKTNAFCLGIILCNVSRSFDYLIYPYYPAYTS